MPAHSNCSVFCMNILFLHSNKEVRTKKKKSSLVPSFPFMTKHSPFFFVYQLKESICSPNSPPTSWNCSEFTSALLIVIWSIVLLVLMLGNIDTNIILKPSPGAHSHILHVRMLTFFSRVWLFATLWIVAHQAPLSMAFSRQEYWSRLPCPSPGDLPDPGIKPTSLYISCIGRWVLYH